MRQERTDGSFHGSYQGISAILSRPDGLAGTYCCSSDAASAYANAPFVMGGYCTDEVVESR